MYKFQHTSLNMLTMRKLIFITANCLFSIVALMSQELSLKYGKITKDELNMKVYPKDTTAAAVVLYEDGYTSFSYIHTIGFQITEEVKRKIKIFKQEGVEEATIAIPFYYKNSDNNESISSIEAYSYNMEDGKVVKTKLDKKYIFEEETSKRYKKIKFSIPNAKVGTIIEYKYNRITNNIFLMPDWKIQRHIPVLSSFYEVKIPEYFYFNIDMKGYEKINVEETSDIQQFSNNSGNYGNIQTFTASCRDIKYTARDIPALKNENYVWCANDFMSEIRFELKGTRYPNDFYKAYSNTWEDLEKALDTETDFTSNLKISDPYGDEIKALVAGKTDEIEKIQLVYLYIKKRINWNESYDFMGANVRTAIKNGIGNNAQINIVLMSALKDAGIKSFPVLLSLRSRGRLPLSFPSLNMISTFIVGAETSEGKKVFMDGSATVGGLNTLPSELLVDRARIFDEEHTDKWVDLSSLGKNQHITNLMVSFDKDGTMTGVQNTLYLNQLAFSFKNNIHTSKDSTKYVEKFQTENQVTIDSLKFEDNNSISNVVKEQVFFTKKYDFTSDLLYINPMIFTHIAKNDFTQSDRKLPVEFNYPYVIQTSCSLTIPDNYKVEELPKSVRIIMVDNKGKCIYQVRQEGNTLQMNYRFELNQAIFPQNQYPELKDFFGQVATKNAEMVVLKKI